MAEAAFGTAITFILLFTYFGVKRVAGYAWLVDIGLFVLFIWLFRGTYAGAVTGILAGLLVTLFLKGVRRTVGAEQIRLVRYQGKLVPEFKWEEIRAGDKS